MSLGTLVTGVFFGANFTDDLFVLFPESSILALVVFGLTYAVSLRLA